MSDDSILIQIGPDSYFQLGFDTVVPRDGRTYNVVAGKDYRSVKFVPSNSEEIANVDVLAERLANLEALVSGLKYGTNEQDISGNTNINTPNEPYLGTGNITESTKIVAKDVILSNVEVQNSYINATASEDISLKNYNTSGTVAKAKSNATISLHADGFITVRDCDIASTGYNAIEAGLQTGLAKSIIIDNVDFAGDFSNNAISIFGMAEGGVITISNCHFHKVSNAIRISNRTNTHFTINLINCKIDEWEATPEYSGAIIFQDYTSKTAQEAQEANQFGKLTLNIQNLTKPDGAVLNTEDIPSICGTGDKNQVLYVYVDKEGLIPYGDRYPAITIK